MKSTGGVMEWVKAEDKLPSDFHLEGRCVLTWSENGFTLAFQDDKQFFRSGGSNHPITVRKWMEIPSPNLN